MIINIKKNNKNAVTPVFAHGTDSGFDLFTCEDITLKPKQKGVANTGLIFELYYPWGIQIKNKSGITINGAPTTEEKADITVYEGTIDIGFRGEVGIMLKNEEDRTITIPKHTKIAQGVLRTIYQCSFNEVDHILEATDRGKCGFGSTGTSI